MGAKENLAARQAAEVYRVAQERIGLLAALAGLQAYRQTNPLQPKRSTTWVREVVRWVIGLRALSRLLAARYANLSRALAEDGKAADNPGGESYGKSVTYTRLLDDFSESVRTVSKIRTPQTEKKASQDSERFDVREQNAEQRTEPSALENLLEDLRKRFPKGEAEVDEDFTFDDPEDGDEYEAIYVKHVEDELTALEKSISSIDDEDLTPAEVRATIQKNANTAGLNVAQWMDDMATRYGHEYLDLTAENDPAVVGWMRVTAADPCAFCAMLASLGVIYKSKSTATETVGGSGSQARGVTRSDRRRSAAGRRNVNETGDVAALHYYHDNCRCTVIPVYSKNLPRLEREKFFDSGWTESTKGVSGDKAKLRAFRKWLNQQYREGNVPTTPVVGPQRPPTTTPTEEN